MSQAGLAHQFSDLSCIRIVVARGRVQQTPAPRGAVRFRLPLYVVAMGGTKYGNPGWSAVMRLHAPPEGPLSNVSADLLRALY